MTEPPLCGSSRWRIVPQTPRPRLPCPPHVPASRIRALCPRFCIPHTSPRQCHKAPHRFSASSDFYRCLCPKLSYMPRLCPILADTSHTAAGCAVTAAAAATMVRSAPHRHPAVKIPSSRRGAVWAGRCSDIVGSPARGWSPSRKTLSRAAGTVPPQRPARSSRSSGWMREMPLAYRRISRWVRSKMKNASLLYRPQKWRRSMGST